MSSPLPYAISYQEQWDLPTVSKVIDNLLEIIYLNPSRKQSLKSLNVLTMDFLTKQVFDSMLYWLKCEPNKLKSITHSKISAIWMSVTIFLCFQFFYAFLNIYFVLILEIVDRMDSAEISKDAEQNILLTKKMKCEICWWVRRLSSLRHCFKIQTIWKPTLWVTSHFWRWLYKENSL